jgi:outer membrane protein OmpA-like peptidoglycan-associated protein
MPRGGPIGPHEGPQWLTPGVALRLRDVVSLQAGVSMALIQPRTRGVQVPEPWTAQIGVSTRFDGREAWARLVQWLNPKPAVLAIDVRDALRRELLRNARLTVFTPTEGPVDGSDGGLTWYGFADAVTWIASAPDYATVTGSTILRGGERTETVILLPPTRGWILGEASAPGTAAVELLLDGPEPVSTALRGAFTMSLVPGRYAGYATAPGAVSQPIEAIIGLGQTVTWPPIRLKAPEPVRAPRAAGEPVIDHVEVEKQRRQLSGVIDEILRKPAAPPQAEAPGARKAQPATTERQIRLGDKAATMEGQSLATFLVGATVLDGEARARVQALARIVQRDPRIRFVIVEGSTDDIGDRATNSRISTERALAVYQVMIDEGVPPEKIGLKISFFALTPERIDDKTREGERQVRIRFIRDEGGE